MVIEEECCAPVKSKWWTEGFDLALSPRGTLNSKNSSQQQSNSWGSAGLLTVENTGFLLLFIWLCVCLCPQSYSMSHVSVTLLVSIPAEWTYSTVYITYMCFKWFTNHTDNRINHNQNVNIHTVKSVITCIPLYLFFPVSFHSPKRAGWLERKLPFGLNYRLSGLAPLWTGDIYCLSCVVFWETWATSWKVWSR